jgi:hypothetical protein
VNRDTDESIAQTLVNTSNGMIISFKNEDNWINVEYENGFNETIWFETPEMCDTFANAILLIRKVLAECKTGKTYETIRRQ